mmetsp:Transcript_15969/g.25560  ORF Transcript_15969/g.25560 Transcript_15969/m.25560 type:complete len:726 (+) Transcript_15969:169-2346(+)
MLKRRTSQDSSVAAGDIVGNGLSENVEDWTSEDVGRFIRALGKGQCWVEYSTKMADVDVDGSTLMDADLEILIDLGFHRIHANKVLRQLHKIINGLGLDDASVRSTSIQRLDGSINTSQPKATTTTAAIDEAAMASSSRDMDVGFPTSLPLTEVEVKRMQLFGDHHELINTCEDKLTHAIKQLLQTRDLELERANKTFDQIHSKIVSERIRCREELTNRHEDMNQVLKEALDQIRKNKDEAKREAKTLYKAMQISDWSKRNERMRTIIKITRTVLQKVQPMLMQVPTLSVEYNENFSKSLEDDDGIFEILQDDPVFEMRATLVAEEERKKREEQVAIMQLKAEEREREQTLQMQEEERALEEARRQQELEAKRRKDIERERKAFLLEKKRREESRNQEKMYSMQAEVKGWAHLPPMRAKRRYLGVAVSPDGSKLFALGGYHGSKYLKSVEVYDFHHRLWTNLPPMLERRCGLGVAMSPDGKRLYAVGGYDGPKHENYLDSVEVFNFRSMKWRRLPSMSTKRAHMGVTISPNGKKLYVVGGNYTERLDSIEVLDTQTNTWKELPSMQSKKSGLGVAISPNGNRLYCVGGFDGQQLSKVEELDLTNKASWKKATASGCIPCSSGHRERILWRPIPSMTHSRRYLGVTISPNGRKLFAIGGDHESNTAEYYDFPSRTWVQLPTMRSKRKGLGVALSPDGKILYAVGGEAIACMIFLLQGVLRRTILTM